MSEDTTAPVTAVTAETTAVGAVDTVVQTAQTAVDAVDARSPLQQLADYLKAELAAAKAAGASDLAAVKSDYEALKSAFTAHLVDFNTLATLVDSLATDGKAFVKKEEGFFHKIGHELEDGAASLLAHVKSWFAKDAVTEAAPTDTQTPPTL